jgi:hypothetical protein
LRGVTGQFVFSILPQGCALLDTAFDAGCAA